MRRIPTTGNVKTPHHCPEVTSPVIGPHRTGDLNSPHLKETHKRSWNREERKREDQMASPTLTKSSNRSPAELIGVHSNLSLASRAYRENTIFTPRLPAWTNAPTIGKLSEVEGARASQGLGKVLPVALRQEVGYSQAEETAVKVSETRPRSARAAFGQVVPQLERP